MRKFPFHPAWAVAGVTLFGLLAASAFRSCFGVLLQPWEQAFGWSRATTSGAASLNLVLYGLSAPVAAAVMEHWGLRRTVVASLGTSGLAAAASLFMTQTWQLWLLWGVVIGIGTGALALTFGAIVANRWFETRRGIQTHFVPAAHDHAMPMTMAANMLGLIGIFDVIGTIASGWLTDRVDPRLLLAIYYLTRGLALIPINQMLASHITPGLWVWLIFYGLDWTATVPPTVALCREHFGLADSGIVFGWVYAAHMVGAGIGASVSGSLRASDGTYTKAWVLTAVLCLLAGAVAVWIGRSRPHVGQLTTSGPSSS